MTGEILVDTNVLVYAYDRSEQDKQKIALSALDHLVAAGVGVLSTQVLGELYVTVTRKLKEPLTMTQATVRVKNYVQSWPVIDQTAMIVLEATRGAEQHQLHFWDAQLWASAKLNQIDSILTEDLPGGTSIEGVHFVNPFAPGFQIDALL